MNSQAQYIIVEDGYLGKGQFGTVYKCHRIQGNVQTLVCVKMIKLAGQNIQMLEREISIMRTLTAENNPNIVGVYDVEEDTSDIKIYMEICEGGDLAQLIQEKKKRGQTYFSMPQAKEILRQILNGYQSLYRNNIIHRDLKPANILLNGDKSVFKITDFGMGRVIEDVSRTFPLTKVGSPAYAAPQLFFDKEFSSKADIYSLGVIFYELVYGELPSGQVKQQSQLIAFLRQCSQTPFVCPLKRKIDNLDIPQDIRTLIEGMLRFREEDRTDWQNLFQQPILKSKIRSVMQSQPSQPQNQNQDNQQVNQQPNTPQSPQQPSIQDSLLLVSQSFNTSSYIHQSQLQDGVSRVQRIKKIIEVLLAKGDLGVKILENLQTNTDLKYINLNPFECVLISTCLIGYKYLTLSNALGFCYCLPEQLDTKIGALFQPQQILEAMQRFASDQEQTKELKSEITNQYYLMNSQFIEWQNYLIKFLNNGIPAELTSFIKLLSLQNPSNFTLYFDWFGYFYKQILLPKLQFQLNVQYPIQYINLLYVVEKFICVEQEFLYKNYQTIKTQEIVQENLDYLVMYNYLRQKRNI